MCVHVTYATLKYSSTITGMTIILNKYYFETKLLNVGVTKTAHYREEHAYQR